MTETSRIESTAAIGAARDERLRQQSGLRRLLSRPELGAFAGAVLVFIFFGITAHGTGMFAADGVLNWTTVSAYLMVIAVGAALLMIAGEFDLSVGSMIGFAGMMIALPTIVFHWPVTLSVIFAFAGALAIGFINGLIVIRTGLPSFIVTLASLYILRGLTLALSILFTNRTIVVGMKEAAEGTFVGFLFSGTIGDPLFTWLADNDIIGRLPNGDPSVRGIPMVVVWALFIALVGHIVLARTKVGNWIFASGGDANAARNVGVPVGAVKISLFMLTAFCATVFAACQVFEFGSAASDRGLLKEFEAIIAAVIGGCLLTGGYGSVIGACLGALIFGVVQMGILFTGVPNDWFRVFLGGMLLIAVLFNNLIRRRVVGGR
ncbi:MAG: ABC transporter permease [Methylobacteriaceae bacterium]|nr:ABC transporter permease [Methylobacteriaceae bacterium]MBV9219514.1 ABC transporter permease [Methylobacteriaceae bacterium]MBV9245914.1 ABC transporter permease [Methylobacteriaceae bacterium]